MTSLPEVTVTHAEPETLTFADGTTITKWSHSIRRVDGDTLPVWFDTYAITSPLKEDIHTTATSYREDR